MSRSWVTTPPMRIPAIQSGNGRIGSSTILVPGIGTPIRTPVTALTIRIKIPRRRENQKLFDQGKFPAHRQTMNAAAAITKAA